jgi:prepilin peptidase CpaA
VFLSPSFAVWLIRTALAIFVICLAAAAASDLAKYRIPNALSIGVAASFALAVPALPFALVLSHAAAGVTVLVIAALCFALRLMGGGDAKLIAAAALWMGWQNLAPFLLLMAVVGGALGLLLLAARRLVPEPPRGRWWSPLLARRAGVPYGVAIAAAAIAMIPHFPPLLLP